jgi:DNA adenine methylase
MNQSATPTRPIMHYFGGKWNLAKWIISHFPPHTNYIEPFGGAASVLLRKKPAKREVYNDLDEHIVDLFRVLRDGKKAQKLIEQIYLTPFSRAEYDDCFDFKEEIDLVEKARKMITVSFLAYGSDVVTRRAKTGFRASICCKRWQSACDDWRYFPDAIYPIVDRLKHVMIEKKDAVELIGKYDSPVTLFYLDPPYPHTTRISDKNYRFEMKQEDHINLLENLNQLEAMVVLSTYDNELYDDYLAGSWQKVHRQTHNQSNKITTEMLWLNRAAVKRQPQKSLFQ